MPSLSHEFIEFAMRYNSLGFGEFKTKAGRISPYFFNAGLFCEGASLHRLAQFYGNAIAATQISFDMLFGSAYKGIPLVAAIACELAEKGHNVPFSYNRKEFKDHGEGGKTVGAPLKGKVLIVDDVISAGTSLRESVVLIKEQGATPCGLAIAFDRLERGAGNLSASQEVQRDFAIPVISIANLNDLLEYLASDPSMAHNLQSIEKYISRYAPRLTDASL